MKTLISFPMDCGILGELELTASADCNGSAEEAVARNTVISAYVPSIQGPGKHIEITHLLDLNELDNISEKLLEAFMIRRESREPESSYN